MISFENIPGLLSGEDFYKTVLEYMPAFIYINEFVEPANYESMRMTWINKTGENFIGYSKEEAISLGFELFSKILHPDDLEIIKTTADFASKGEIGSQYVIMQRAKSANSGDYVWLYGKTMLLEVFDNHQPKKSLNVCFEITDQMHTENQLKEALKEISRLKNELKIAKLGKREKEILELISKGYTDKEIGLTLHISVSTAKTHRNKLIKKIGVKNTATLVAFSKESGF